MSATQFDKIVIITKKTPLEELIERFNSKEQAKFYIEHSGSSFEEYEKAHYAYKSALDNLMDSLPLGVKNQYIERSFLPNFLFGDKDLVVTLGPDGLVINTAKYLNNQPIFAVNPDSLRVDGILIPFNIDSVKTKIIKVLEGNYSISNISMAKAKLNDGQELYGVNDIFVGAKTHISFRYSVKFENYQENQSSSGIIVSTGAGSTGWFRSIIAGAKGISYIHRTLVESSTSNQPRTKIEQAERETTSVSARLNLAETGEGIIESDSRFNWDADYLYFSVREPFPSKTSKINIMFGRITKDDPLYITSHMPQNGVIFSDGIEQDYLEFNSGKIACLSLADKKTKLIKNI
jgi:NAD kinase